MNENFEKEEFYYEELSKDYKEIEEEVSKLYDFSKDNDEYFLNYFDKKYGDYVKNYEDYVESYEDYVENYEDGENYEDVENYEDGENTEKLVDDVEKDLYFEDSL